MKKVRVTVLVAMFSALSLTSCSEKDRRQGESSPQPSTAPPIAQTSKISVDAGLTDYKTVSGISGNISSVGSDTMNNLMALWAEGFGKFYPSVKIHVEGKGSSTAPPALISGTAQIGPMSRAMKSSEIDAFEKKFGYKPIQLWTAIDALAVFVNKDNPLDCLALDVVDAIFSKSL